MRVAGPYTHTSCQPQGRGGAWPSRDASRKIDPSLLRRASFRTASLDRMPNSAVPLVSVLTPEVAQTRVCGAQRRLDGRCIRPMGDAPLLYPDGAGRETGASQRRHWASGQAGTRGTVAQMLPLHLVSAQL